MDKNNEYFGLTVNERLYVSGLIDKYYKAVEERDINTVISILKTIELDEEDIHANLKLNGLTSENI